jgi:hypothetical protein
MKTMFYRDNVGPYGREWIFLIVLCGLERVPWYTGRVGERNEFEKTRVRG